ncbi:MAG: metallophosphoesterase [Acidobacteriota bacterium]
MLLLSDIHFDPFHDPSKLDALRDAPIDKWAAILSAPASPTMATAYAQLQGKCATRGVDTPFPLLQDSLMAAHTRQPHPLFITVSGDIMAHAFDCRFHTLAPKATEAEYSDFAAKTIAFVALQLHHHFPATPAYLALGNNDSGCTDYHETPNSPFLQANAQTFADAALNPANSAAILSSFPEFGDYNIPLPAPIRNARLIVLQDIFQSKAYGPCPGTKIASTQAPATAQLAWLRDQLTQAREHHQHVWVMAHIPPGVDPYTTLRSSVDVCAGKPPAMFLRNEALAATLADFPDVIRLVLFAHSHMDEIRLIESPEEPKPGATPGLEAAIPVKFISSISPVDGNLPSFTVAEVSPATATLKDYTVFSANSQAASAWMQPPSWREEYRYSTTFHLPDFSAASVAKLSARFLSDKTGTSPSEIAYEEHYFISDGSLSATLKQAALQFVWPKYACAIAQSSIAGYTTCACPITDKPAPKPVSQP